MHQRHNTIYRRREWGPGGILKQPFQFYYNAQRKPLADYRCERLVGIIALKDMLDFLSVKLDRIV